MICVIVKGIINGLLGGLAAIAVIAGFKKIGKMKAEKKSLSFKPNGKLIITGQKPIEVGKAVFVLTTNKNETFETTCYGTSYHWDLSYGTEYKIHQEPSIGEIRINHISTLIEQNMRCHLGKRDVIDDCQAPKKAMLAKFIKVELKEILPHQEMLNVFEIVPNETLSPQES